MKQTTTAVDIVVRWGVSVLYTGVVLPGRVFRIGEDPSRCACVAPESLLGCREVTLLWWDTAMQPRIASGPSGTPLLHGEFVARLGTLRVELSVHERMTPARRSGNWRRAARLSWTLLLSLVSHAVCALTLCLLVPPPAAAAAVDVPRSEERMFAYRTVKLEPEPAPYDDGIGGDGELTKEGNAGEGRVAPRGRAGTWGNAGPQDNPDAFLGRLGAEYGWGGWLWRPDALPRGSPFGRFRAERFESLGRDVWSATGHVLAHPPIASHGREYQRRVGGNADVGVGDPGGADRFGDGLIAWTQKPDARRRRTHTVGAPSLHRRLPARTIRRVVERHAGALRLCRTQARDRHAVELSVRFVISPEGAVKQVRTTAGDEGLTRCVRSVFERMEFSAPPDGSVQVTIPVVFDDEGW